MTLQAEISLYPLGEPLLLPVIEDFVQRSREHGLNPQIGAMSTVVVGESEIVFSAISKAFASAAREHRCVLVVKYSNACPAPQEI